MVIRAARLGRRLISERHIAIRSKHRIRYVTLTRSWQIAGLCALLICASAFARLTVGYITSDRKAAHRAAEVAQAEMSNDELRELVAQLRGRLGSVTREADLMRARLAATVAQNLALRGDLSAAETRLHSIDETRTDLQSQRETAQSRLKGAEDALAAKSAQIARMSQSLDAAKSDLKQTEQQRSGLVSHLHVLESDFQAATKEASQFKAAAELAERKLQQVIAERDGLRARLALAQQTHPEKGHPDKLALTDSAAISGPIAADPAVTPQGLGYLASETHHGWGELVKVLSSAGVDLDELAAHYGAVPSGQGGPFVALKGLKASAAPGGEVLSDGARKLLKALPLSAPVSQYQLESRFGVRVDPFNHRQSMHTGLDFAAPFKSPVYNTAPGVVVFAGPKGEYGKAVDIDHGSGIVTRYAHLHRITVALGQRLDARVQIGLLGSTGRSTGPHLHYEVLVNGTAQDPEKFLEAGRNVVQAAGN